ncbi:MAG: hypothetical protein K2M87_01035, partial [Muribaculaceae bacterium]|nr:hypothetical protein [Muribaculaceae bacterium]
MKNTLTTLALFLFGIGYASGELVSDSIEIGFRQSHIEIDRDFERNGEKIDSIFAKLHQDSSIHHSRTLRRVEVIGAASPEGSDKFNKYLSEKRAKAILSLFPEYNTDADSILTMKYLGRDWSGLKSSVEFDSEVPDRDEVLTLLGEITGSAGTIDN